MLSQGRYHGIRPLQCLFQEMIPKAHRKNDNTHLPPKGMVHTVNITATCVIAVGWPAIGCFCWPGTCFPTDKSDLKRERQKAFWRVDRTHHFKLFNGCQPGVDTNFCYHNCGTYSMNSMISVYQLCTLQPPSCCPLPLLLRGKPLALPQTEGLSIIPAHLDHWEVQTLPNAWARSCRLNSQGSN